MGMPAEAWRLHSVYTRHRSRTRRCKSRAHPADEWVEVTSYIPGEGHNLQGIPSHDLWPPREGHRASLYIIRHPRHPKARPPPAPFEIRRQTAKVRSFRMPRRRAAEKGSTTTPSSAISFGEVHQQTLYHGKNPWRNRSSTARWIFERSGRTP